MIADRKALYLFLTVAVVAAGPAAQVPEDRPDETAQELVERAARLLDDERMAAALELLDRAVEAAPDYWEAHYHRGRALGMLGRMEEARDAFLRVTELEPGMANAHHLASVAAYNATDFETAWEQAILAHQAGNDMTAMLEEMQRVAPPPEGLEERLRAPRVYVADFDVADLRARWELPINRNELAPEPFEPDVDSAAGVERLQEAGAELLRVLHRLRTSVSGSPAFGLVRTPERAELVLRIQIDELGKRPPRRLSGYLQVLSPESGDSLYRRRITLRDIDAAGILHGEIERHIDDLAAWYRDHQS